MNGKKCDKCGEEINGEENWFGDLGPVDDKCYEEAIEWAIEELGLDDRQEDDDKQR